MRRVLALGVVVAASTACALFGFDLGGYHPAGGAGGTGGAGGGASGTHSTSNGPGGSGPGGHGGAGGASATSTGVGAGGAGGGCGDGVVNTGQFCFRQPKPFLVGGTPAGLAVVDLDGQHGAEIVVGLPAASQVSVLESQGGRAFAPAVQFQASAGVNHLAFGPVDADTKLDVVAGNTSTVSTFENISGAMVQLQQQSFLAAQGVGHPVVLLDANGDAAFDIAVGDGSLGNIEIYLNSGTGTFGTSSTIALGASQITALATADLDEDGKPDLVVVDAVKAQVHILINIGNGFAASSTIVLGQTPVALVIADVDGNNTQDIALANTDGSIGILLGNGNGAFQSIGTIPVSTNLVAIAVGDLDADGKLDLAVVDASDGLVHLMKNLGSGFDPGPTLGPFNGPTDVALKDLDGDGALDVVVLEPPAKGVSVVFSNP